MSIESIPIHTHRLLSPITVSIPNGPTRIFLWELGVYLIVFRPIREICMRLTYKTNKQNISLLFITQRHYSYTKHKNFYNFQQFY